MDIGLTIVVILVVLAVAVLLVAWGRGRRLEQRRRQAAEHRHEAEIHAANAQRGQAEAAERAARADREQAQAREQEARAQQERAAADARRAEADRIDPDAETRDEPADTPGGRHAAAAGDAARPHDEPRMGDAGDRGTAGVGYRAEQQQSVDPAARTDEVPVPGGGPRSEGPGRPVDSSAGSAHIGGAHDMRHGAGRADQDHVDPAARTDEVPVPGAGPRSEGPGRPVDSSAGADHTGGADHMRPRAGRGDQDHGDTARPDDVSLNRDRVGGAGGPGGADPAARTHELPQPTGGRPGMSEGSPAAAEGRAEADRASGAPVAPGVPGAGADRARSVTADEVPAQRTREPDDTERPHGGRVRALADRLLHRNG